MDHILLAVPHQSLHALVLTDTRRVLVLTDTRRALRWLAGGNQAVPKEHETRLREGPGEPVVPICLERVERAGGGFP